MDRSRKSRNDRSPRCPAEVPRRQRCAPRRANIAVKNFGSILALTMLTAATVSSTHVPDKYPIEVYHMLREKTQFALGRDNRIRGTWGPWSSWSECSRTCGTGIQSQSRECVPYQRLLRKRSIISENGTSNSRPICIGTYKRYHTCNTQKCPNFPEDLRAEQCAKYNGRNYKGESYDWVPFLDAPNSCALNCRAVGEPFYATLESAVMDGTPCDAPNLRGYNTGISMERTDRWLCVAGQCKPVGCARPNLHPDITERFPLERTSVIARARKRRERERGRERKRKREREREKERERERRATYFSLHLSFVSIHTSILFFNLPCSERSSNSIISTPRSYTVRPRVI